MTFMLQGAVFGIPLLFVVESIPVALYLVLVFLIFIKFTTVLLFDVHSAYNTGRGIKGSTGVS